MAIILVIVIFCVFGVGVPSFVFFRVLGLQFGVGALGFRVFRGEGGG